MLLLLLAVSCSAQLSRDEKQQILDLHNYNRASVNAAGMRRLVRTTACALYSVAISSIKADFQLKTF